MTVMFSLSIRYHTKNVVHTLGTTSKVQCRIKKLNSYSFFTDPINLIWDKLIDQ